MGEDSPKTIARSSVAFLFGTLLSRFSGLGRDMMMAFCFGSHPAIAAFMVAFRFSNLIRRLFGEGPLTSSFIPHFEQLRQTSPQEGARFFRDLFFTLSAFLILLVVVIEGGLWGWLHWSLVSEGTREILEMTLWMFPGMIFICLFGLGAALLQCDRKYFLSGVAPLGFNLVWIGAAFLLKDLSPSAAALGLSAAITLAFAAQWLLTVPHTVRLLREQLPFSEWFQVRWFSESIRKVVKPILLSIVGIGAVQINSALDALFARFASLEGPAYLWYALRIQQLPLALFGIALSASLLPPLARAVKDQETFRRLLSFSLQRSYSLILPCTLAILTVGAVTVNLLYGRGDFTPVATYQTVICLWAYALGLLPSVFVLILAPAFYAQKDFRTPTIAALLSVAINSLLSLFMIFIMGWGPFSIALATSFSAWFNFLYLSRRLGSLPQFWRSCLKTTSCGLIACLATLLVGHLLCNDPALSILLGSADPTFPRHLLDQITQFLALAGTFTLVLFSYSWMTNAEDLLDLIGVKRR